VPFSTTIVFYLLIGAATAVAVFVAETSTGSRSFQAALAILFWPILLPLLISAPRTEDETKFSLRNLSAEQAPRSGDAMSAAISQVEVELDSALQSLDGWSEGMLSREADRIGELKTAWCAQADRIRELDGLLAQPGYFDEPVESIGEPSGPATETDERVHSAEQTRQINIRKLRQMRQQMHRDLMGTLAWVRELVTMIHLAKFGGAPASRAEELVAQIAAAVEGLSEVTAWSPDSNVRRETVDGVAF
jgi:hypothetical protein